LLHLRLRINKAFQLASIGETFGVSEDTDDDADVIELRQKLCDACFDTELKRVSCDLASDRTLCY